MHQAHTQSYGLEQGLETTSRLQYLVLCMRIHMWLTCALVTLKVSHTVAKA